MALRAVNRPKVDSVPLWITSGMTGGEVNEMFSVWQKPWPAMGGVLAAIDYRRWHRGVNLRAHFRQGTRKVRGEHNHIVGAPTSAAGIGRIGDRGNRTARRRNLHQLAAGKKADVAAIRRPERMRSARSSIQWLRRIAAQRPNPQQLGFTRMRYESDLVSLGRKYGHAARVARGIQGKLIWRRNFGMKRNGLLGRFCPTVSSKRGDCNENEHKRRQPGSP